MDNKNPEFKQSIIFPMLSPSARKWVMGIMASAPASYATYITIKNELITDKERISGKEELDNLKAESEQSKQKIKIKIKIKIQALKEESAEQGLIIDEGASTVKKFRNDLMETES